MVAYQSSWPFLPSDSSSGSSSSGSPPIADKDQIRLVRDYLRLRRTRNDMFPDGLFADPAWDLLLDLYACQLEGREVSVSSACLASGVASTTALRWISRLEELALLVRRPDPGDRRRMLLQLSSPAVSRMAMWVDRLNAREF